MSINWADNQLGAEIIDYSSQIDGCEASNVLINNNNKLWLTSLSNELPQWICISLLNISNRSDIIIRTIGWYCWHNYISNPKVITVYVSTDSYKFKQWDQFTSIDRYIDKTINNSNNNNNNNNNIQLFCCAPISISIYPYIAFEINETIGQCQQTYINQIYLYSEEIVISNNALSIDLSNNNKFPIPLTLSTSLDKSNNKFDNLINESMNTEGAMFMKSLDSNIIENSSSVKDIQIVSSANSTIDNYLDKEIKSKIDSSTTNRFKYNEIEDKVILKSLESSLLSDFDLLEDLSIYTQDIIKANTIHNKSLDTKVDSIQIEEVANKTNRSDISNYSTITLDSLVLKPSDNITNIIINEYEDRFITRSTNTNPSSIASTSEMNYKQTNVSIVNQDSSITNTSTNDITNAIQSVNSKLTIAIDKLDSLINKYPDRYIDKSIGSFDGNPNISVNLEIESSIDNRLVNHSIDSSILSHKNNVDNYSSSYIDSKQRYSGISNTMNSYIDSEDISSIDTITNSNIQISNNITNNSIRKSIDSSINKTIDNSINDITNKIVNNSSFNSIDISKNQSIDDSVDRSKSSEKPTNMSNDTFTYKVTDKSIDTSADRSINKSIETQISQSVDRLSHRSSDDSIGDQVIMSSDSRTNSLISKLVGQSINSSNDISIDKSIDKLIDKPSSRLSYGSTVSETGKEIDTSVNRSTDRITNESIVNEDKNASNILLDNSVHDSFAKSFISSIDSFSIQRSDNKVKDMLKEKSVVRSINSSINNNDYKSIGAIDNLVSINYSDDKLSNHLSEHKDSYISSYLNAKQLNLANDIKQTDRYIAEDKYMQSDKQIQVDLTLRDSKSDRYDDNKLENYSFISRQIDKSIERVDSNVRSDSYILENNTFNSRNNLHIQVDNSIDRVVSNINRSIIYENKPISNTNYLDMQIDKSFDKSIDNSSLTTPSSISLTMESTNNQSKLTNNQISYDNHKHDDISIQTTNQSIQSDNSITQQLFHWKYNNHFYQPKRINRINNHIDKRLVNKMDNNINSNTSKITSEDSVSDTGSYIGSNASKDLIDKLANKTASDTDREIDRNDIYNYIKYQQKFEILDYIDSYNDSNRSNKYKYIDSNITTIVDELVTNRFNNEILLCKQKSKKHIKMKTKKQINKLNKFLEELKEYI